MSQNVNLVLRIHTDRKDLIISGDYIAHGMRGRAQKIMTEWLGPRTEREIQESLTREVTQERWTPLDRIIHQGLDQGMIDLREEVLSADDQRQRALLKARLDTLTRLGLADEISRGVWAVSPEAERTLNQLAKRAEIVRAIRRAFPVNTREYSIYDRSAETGSVTGRLAAKGLADELNERGYLIVDGIDGKAHYVEVASSPELGELPIGAVVTVRQSGQGRAADRNIAAVGPGGIYTTADHLDQVRTSGQTRYDPEGYVGAHVRRLEALRRAGLVERLGDGVWKVPADLVAKGLAYDRAGGRNTALDVRSYVPLERQIRVIGATWLDGELGAGQAPLSAHGFGGEVRQALGDRERFITNGGFVDLPSGRVPGSCAQRVPPLTRARSNRGIFGQGKRS